MTFCGLTDIIFFLFYNAVLIFIYIIVKVNATLQQSQAVKPKFIQ